LGLVLRVLNELPHPQVTTLSWYLGWIPSFMISSSIKRSSEIVD
jgi:hypothetical protein